jgi:hypothetical protein
MRRQAVGMSRNDMPWTLRYCYVMLRIFGYDAPNKIYFPSCLQPTMIGDMQDLLCSNIVLNRT